MFLFFVKFGEYDYVVAFGLFYNKKKKKISENSFCPFSARNFALMKSQG